MKVTDMKVTHMNAKHMTVKPTKRIGSRPWHCAAACAWLLLAAGASAQSLYSEGSFKPLVEDRRAYRIGDVLTVLVYENASATASANTTTAKTNGLNIGVRANGRDHGGSISVGDDFAGKGQIQRTGRLAAQLSVTVDGVAPNGDLLVSGKQDILINGEKQLLQVAGRVRPIDVSEINTVPSTRLADANITYVGDGILAEKQRQGILTRFLSWLGLV